LHGSGKGFRIGIRIMNGLVKSSQTRSNRINREWTRIDANDSGDSPIKPGQTQAIEIDLRLDGVRTNQERPDVRAVSPHRLKLGRDRSAVALRALDKLVWEVDRAEDVVVVLFRCHFFLRL